MEVVYSSDGITIEAEPSEEYGAIYYVMDRTRRKDDQYIGNSISYGEAHDLVDYAFRQRLINNWKAV